MRAFCEREHIFRVNIVLSAVKTAIEKVAVPILDVDLVTAGINWRLESDQAPSLRMCLPIPIATLHTNFKEALQDALLRSGISGLNIIFETDISATRIQTHVPAINGVKNLLAVASGKGGVGKSTIAVNLALALVREGATVGLLDADVYGPSQPLMLGLKSDDKPETKGNYLVPKSVMGLQMMSMGLLANENTPMVWRGPMVSGALQQLLMQTLWRDLDYLIVDMPPGTGDAQLTLSQKVPVDGAIVVTTPQEIALLDARKGIEMFRKVMVPLLGLVENMSQHTCSGCGRVEPIFGANGGHKLASDYEVPLLAQLPLDRAIREQTDQGCPPVLCDPEGSIAQLYLEMARNVAASLWKLSQQTATTVPNIKILDD